MKRLISLFLCVVMVFSLCACGTTEENTADEAPVATASASQEAGSAEDIPVLVIDETDTVADAVSQEIEDGTIDDIYSLVCGSVAYELTDAGFTCDTGVAETLENEDYNAFGLYYTNDDLDFYSDNRLKACGFVEVVSSEEPFYQPDDEESIIGVYPVSHDDLAEDDDEAVSDTELLCTYNYTQLGSSHFVYQGKYVVYYQQTAMRVVYTVLDNDPENYDLSLGSLYDYDNNEYIYDESIWGTYTTHSAVDLFSEEDYAALEAYYQQLAAEQEAAGYIIDELKVIYISPESIQAYLDSDEQETFFGYSVSDLESAFGVGVALEYTENGFEEASILQQEDYNWKSFLIKVGIGTGLVVVTAAVACATGGATVPVTLVASIAGGTALQGVLTAAVDMAKGMFNGQTVTEALSDSKYDILDKTATAFMIIAAIECAETIIPVFIPETATFTATETAAAGKSVTTYTGPETVIYNVSSQRQRAVSRAWAREVKAVTEGTSKYNWTTEEMEELLSIGKIAGYEGHHIITVSELVGTAKESLIGSADNIVFLTKAEHNFVHSFGDTFAETSDALVELVPWITERLAVLGVA